MKFRKHEEVCQQEARLRRGVLLVRRRKARWPGGMSELTDVQTMAECVVAFENRNALRDSVTEGGMSTVLDMAQGGWDRVKVTDREDRRGW
jgi:hypothetical protein